MNYMVTSFLFAMLIMVILVTSSSFFENSEIQEISIIPKLDSNTASLEVQDASINNKREQTSLSLLTDKNEVIPSEALLSKDSNSNKNIVKELNEQEFVSLIKTQVNNNSVHNIGETIYREELVINLDAQLKKDQSNEDVMTDEEFKKLMSIIE